MCGGTLVEDANRRQWIVTAAHCINIWGSSIPRTLDSLVVEAGGVDRRKDRNWQTRNIPLDSNHIIIHPRWRGQGPFLGSECADAKGCKYCFREDHYGKFGTE